MPKKTTRILLLENNLADAGFIRDALSELDESRQGNNWLNPYELCDAESLEEALALLSEISFEAILFNPWLEDSSGLATLQRLKAASPNSALIVLLNLEDPNLTVRMVQEGAQDVLVKHEVDCTPLGRAIRCAMERVRISSGLRRMSMRDELTGMLNYTGFLQIGDPYANIIRSRSEPSLCSIIKIGNLEAIADLYGRHEQDWLLLELGEFLRPLHSRIDVSSHLGDGSFALLYPVREQQVVQQQLNRLPALLSAKAKSRGAGFDVQIQIGTAPLDGSTSWSLELAMDHADEALWENGPDRENCRQETTSLIQ